MVDYSQIIKGPLNELAGESGEDWDKAAELIGDLNNCSPNEKDKKEEI